MDAKLRGDFVLHVVKRWFRGLGLSVQFFLVAVAGLGLSMATLAAWTERQITLSILSTAAADGRIFMQALVEAKVQNIGSDGKLPATTAAELDELFVSSPLASNFVSVKIWRRDGTVIYASQSKDIIGRQFQSEDVERAFSGEIVTEYKNITGMESSFEQSLEIPLIEIYAPIYNVTTRDVIAVGEFYDNAQELTAELSKSRWLTRLVVLLTTVTMLSFLFIVVRGASHTIEAQRQALSRRLIASERLAAQNAALRADAENTRLHASRVNEELIGRIGLDLHDGPIQLLSLLVLRLDGIETGRRSSGEREKTLIELRGITGNVIRELRELSTGLILPELGELNAREAIELAVSRHEHLTGVKVDMNVGRLPEVPDEFKICLYRIAQESLNNSYRHAGGIGQKVRAAQSGTDVVMTISDEGLGLTGDPKSMPDCKMGLRGIQSRVKAFGGSVKFDSMPSAGTAVTVTLPLSIRAA